MIEIIQNRFLVLVEENNYVTTLKDGTSTYSSPVQAQVKNMTKDVFDSWVEPSVSQSEVNLESIIAVPVTGALAYADLNEPYKKNVDALKKKYVSTPNILSYAVRYDFISDGKNYSAMCFVGRDSAGKPIATDIAIFAPQSDEYITAVYTVLYPNVPAMIFQYPD